MIYLSADDVISINEAILEEKSQLRDRNTLESAVARPQASAFGEDAYPTIPEKAAALLHSLILNHPFVDGNKRTATASMLLFLEYNGYQVILDQLTAADFIIEVAIGKHDISKISEWLTQHMTSLDTEEE